MKKQSINAVFFAFALCLGIFFQACERKDVVYEKKYDFENHIMTNAKPMMFEFENTSDTFQLYNIVLSVVHERVVPTMRMPLIVEYDSPRGDTVSIPISIPLYNAKYQLIGDVREDSLVELRQPLFYSNTLQQGHNMFAIQLDNHADSLFGIVSVGLSIERAN